MAPFLPNIPIGSNQTQSNTGGISLGSSWFGDGIAWANAVQQAQNQQALAEQDAYLFGGTPPANSTAYESLTQDAPPPPVTTATVKPKDWKKHPALLAFLRQYGFDKELLESELEALKIANAAQIGRDAILYEDQRIVSRDKVNVDAEERGMFGAGKRLIDVAKGRKQIDQAEQAAKDNLLADQLVEEERIASELAQLELDKSEAELDAKANTTTQYA